MGKLEDWLNKPSEELNISDVEELLAMGSDDALKTVYLDMILANQGFAVSEKDPYYIMREIVTKVIKLNGGDDEDGKMIFEDMINKEAASRWYISVCTKR